MPAYLHLEGIEGECKDQDHDKWIIIESMSSPIHRSLPAGAKDQQRTKGETTLGDIVVVRQMDKSSTKLQQACANGTFYDTAEIHFCSTVKGKQEPYLKYKLEDVIVSSYSFHGNSSGMPLPSEQVTLAFTAAEWTYIVLNPETGDNDGNVVGKYEPDTGKS